MPKTPPDSSFTAVLKRFVDEGCGGVKQQASRKLSIERQHLYYMLKGTAPCNERKNRLLAVMAKAGYYPETEVAGVRESVTNVTENVTGSADTAALVKMLRYLADLVENSGQSNVNPTEFLDQEGER